MLAGDISLTVIAVRATVRAPVGATVCAMVFANLFPSAEAEEIMPELTIRIDMSAAQRDAERLAHCCKSCGNALI